MFPFFFFFFLAPAAVYLKRPMATMMEQMQRTTPAMPRVNLVSMSTRLAEEKRPRATETYSSMTMYEMMTVITSEVEARASSSSMPLSVKKVMRNVSSFSSATVVRYWTSAFSHSYTPPRYSSSSELSTTQVTTRARALRKSMPENLQGPPPPPQIGLLLCS